MILAHHRNEFLADVHEIEEMLVSLVVDDTMPISVLAVTELKNAPGMKPFILSKTGAFTESFLEISRK